MATMRSLGVHTPSALPILISEGVLPEDPPASMYKWETYYDAAHKDLGLEEILTTDNCVVWSSNGVVKQVFNFEVEQQKVQHAILTWFPTEDGIAPQFRHSGSDSAAKYQKIASSTSGPKHAEPRARALVVVLKIQAHICFLDGPTHVINLPFEVERVFQAPRGLVLQRKLALQAFPETPIPPSVPNNSFFSSPPVRRYQQSGPSLGVEGKNKVEPNQAWPGLDFNLLRKPVEPVMDVSPRHYSLIDPLAEMGLIVHDISDSTLRRPSAGMHGDRFIESLDKDEDLLYVSPNDEIPSSEQFCDTPLVLLVTANYISRTFSIWYGSYIGSKPVSSLLKGRRSSFSGQKARRRSSYLTTGANTPAVRGRESIRESFNAPSRGKTRPASLSGSQLHPAQSSHSAEDVLASQLDPDYDSREPAKDSRRVSSLLSRAEKSTSFDRTAFHDLASHRGGARESLGGQSHRGHSMGASSDRFSFGISSSHRKHRASTPGAHSNRSFDTVSGSRTLLGGTVSASQDLTDDEDFDDFYEGYSIEEELELHQPLGGLRKEFFVTKFAELQMGKPSGPGASFQHPGTGDPVSIPFELPNAVDVVESWTENDDAEVLPLSQLSYKPRAYHESTLSANDASLKQRIPRVTVIKSPRYPASDSPSGRQFFVHIMNYGANEHISVEIGIEQRGLPTEVATKHVDERQHRSVLIPFLKKATHQASIIDVIKIADRGMERLVCLKDNVPAKLRLWIYGPWCQELAISLSLERLRWSNPTKVDLEAAVHSSPPRTVGAQRTLPPPHAVRYLEHPGPNGTFDVLGSDGNHHRVQIQLSPSAEAVAEVLTLGQFVLPAGLGEWLQVAWWNRLEASDTDPQKEWDALISALLLLPLGTMEIEAPKKPKMRNQKTASRPRNSVSGLPGGAGSAWDDMWQSERAAGRIGFLNTPSWSWAADLAALSRSEQTPLKNPQTVEPAFNSILQMTQEFSCSEDGKRLTMYLRQRREGARHAVGTLLVGLHLLREERKLNSSFAGASFDLCAVLAQLGRWLGWPGWDWEGENYYGLELANVEGLRFDDSTFSSCLLPQPDHLTGPPAIYEWLEQAISTHWTARFPDLSAVFTITHTAAGYADGPLDAFTRFMTPRTTAIRRYFQVLRHAKIGSPTLVEAIPQCGITELMLETLPEAVSAIIKESLVRCRANPPTVWSADFLKLVSREDLNLVRDELPRSDSLSGPIVRRNHRREISVFVTSANLPQHLLLSPRRDFHTIAHSVEPDANTMLGMVKKDSVSALIFDMDRRFILALRMNEPSLMAEVDCPVNPAWSQAQELEAQREVAQHTMTRTLALAPGLGMARYGSRRPLLAEKYQLAGYNVQIKMLPSNNIVQVDRTAYTEERYGWAWFHAGVAAGMAISREAQGIDTSWIVFNKPAEPQNRHAGLLLGLGLNGHLKNIARWLAFKYLTPKHTMTSIGLLLGMSASYLGTMDTLVTRLLSVHVTRMLPPGAAELNLSPLAQTTGLMGIGLLYYNTQHRRMSEIMLSEIENIEENDPSGTTDPLRDEGYRLAAGFALGYINLSKGKDLQGLHDMRIVERLLSIAVGPKPVHLVHILDQATAGATLALGLIFMKTNNKAVARKVDVPDTLPQFDFVRPDILLLRTLSKHLILWDEIRPDDDWLLANLPSAYHSFLPLSKVGHLESKMLPFYNILAGLLWAISLRHAGTGDTEIRDFLLRHLDELMRLCHLTATHYDQFLTKNTVRNCQDLLALATTTVMAGTGDLEVMRRLRRLHGRLTGDIPYGSHMASHMALGALFAGGGMFTFGTSDLAVASLIVAFYPLFPMEAWDNRAHLQALRHFWVFAVDPRCIVTRNIDTDRAVHLPILVTLRNGRTKKIIAPALLPDLDTISRIATACEKHWPVVLDFEHNPAHLAAFRSDQTLHVRRRPPHSISPSPFVTTMVAHSEAGLERASRAMWERLFSLPAFRPFDGPVDFDLLMPRGTVGREKKSTFVDDGLALITAAHGRDRDRLVNLRVLFKWGEWAAANGGGQLRWIGRSFLQTLQAIVEERSSRLAGSEGGVYG